MVLCINGKDYTVEKVGKVLFTAIKHFDLRVSDRNYDIEMSAKTPLIKEKLDGRPQSYKWYPFFVYGNLPRDIMPNGIIEFEENKEHIIIHYNDYCTVKDGTNRLTHKFEVEYAEIKQES